jgi:hypothetical protein
MTQTDPTSNNSEQAPAPSRRGRRAPWRPLAWGLVAVVALVAGWQLINLLAAPPAPVDFAAAPAASATPNEAPAPFPTPDPAFVLAGAGETAAAPALPAAPLATPTLAAGDTLARVTPAAAQAGWVASNEARGNHFGDSFLHAGVVQGQIFHGALQLDLSRVPRGAPIRYAALTLTGLDDRRLDRTANNAWSLRWLAPEINENWSRASFQEIHNAAVVQTILPPLSQADLAPFAANQFIFSEPQLRLLEQALVDNQTQIAFRLDGPEVGGDDLFTWDSGYGPATRDNPPALLIVAGPAPATPPPIPTQDFVVVTSTPTPANVLTAAAIVVQATAQAQTTGTATPTPRNLVTATPTPQNAQTAEAQRLLAGLPLVVIPTAVPENGATAAALAAYATAVAITTGTFTPLPPGYVTATPTPPWAVVTNTPTAQSIFQLLERVIVEATRTATAGPPTPLPAGVATATPTRTSTPVPLNAETAHARIIMVTIEALTTGTWTPTYTATPSATPAGAGSAPATPTPQPIPFAAVTLVEGAPQAVVLSNGVNVRAGPGTQFPVAGVLPAGARISLQGRSQDSSWLLICCVDGQPAWLAQFLVQPEGAIEDLPIRSAPTGLLDRFLGAFTVRPKPIS